MRECFLRGWFEFGGEGLLRNGCCEKEEGKGRKEFAHGIADCTRWSVERRAKNLEASAV
jgi:hypothetical protein